jgi:hypothetical protein
VTKLPAWPVPFLLFTAILFTPTRTTAQDSTTEVFIPQMRSPSPELAEAAVRELVNRPGIAEDQEYLAYLELIVRNRHRPKTTAEIDALARLREVVILSTVAPVMGSKTGSSRCRCSAGEPRGLGFESA